MSLRLNSLLRLSLVAAAFLCLPSTSLAQVHYYPASNRPWSQRAQSGPDAEVEGWYYNLGITGLRVELTEEAPRHLLVRHVFEGTPAASKVRVGDYIVGAGGKRFKTDHINGYGMDCFGADGPILDFANALEKSQTKKGKGKLKLRLERDGKTKEVTLSVKQKYGAFDKKFPGDCKKSAAILKELLEYLVDNQHSDGSFGTAPINTFASLALLSSGKNKHLSAVEKCVKMYARSTNEEGETGGLVNWRYMTAGILMSEYYLATNEKWVIKELEEVYAFLIKTQYVDLSQLSPNVKNSHPGALPKDAMSSHGGWGHNPGFEGYGPISMITGQGALCFALMARCGIDVDRERHEAAYAFLERGTGRNGYVAYGDSASGPNTWADMGRTGAAGIANSLSPYKGSSYKKQALLNSEAIGTHPESFPDTHASPIMGMGYSALAANIKEENFRKLMDANRWWFALSQCADGSFYYQPNRDSSGYGGDSRMSATAATALIFSIPNGNLHVTGKRK